MGQNNNHSDNELNRLKNQLFQIEKENQLYKQQIEQYQNELKLQNESILQSKKILETLPVGVVIFTKEGKVIKYNKHFIKLFGYTIDDLIDVNNWFQVVYPDPVYRNLIVSQWFSHIEEYNQTGYFKPLEAKVKCKNDTYKIIEFGFESFGDINITTFFDITERKQAEEKKNISEWKYKIISDIITDYIFVVDIEDDSKLTFKWASENLQRITGRAQNEIGGIENWAKIVHPDYQIKLYTFIKNIIKSGGPAEFECKSFSKEGSIRWINIYAQKLINIENGKNSIIGAVKDITQNKKNEEALREREEKYRNLIENVNEVIYIHDINGVFTYVSPQIETIFGYKVEEVMEIPWQNFSTEHAINLKSSAKISRNIDTKSKSPMINIYEILDKNKKRLFLEATERLMFDEKDNILGIIGSIRDITERKKVEDELKNHRNKLEILVNERTEELQVMNEELRSVNEELYYANEQLEKQKEELHNAFKQLKEAQAQLIQTEKMASVGVLTAGVAHEINNPLNFVQAGIYKLEDIYEVYASQLQNDELNETFKDAINYIDTGVKRATEIVKSLTRLSRKGVDVKQPCNLNSIIDSCLILLNNEIKYKCSVVKKYETPEFIIPGIEGKLHQVFLNVLLNAIQAMDSGTITIQTSNNTAEQKAEIKITDTGKGIDPEHLPKIFDPFFTTKEPGKGTGLGLSIVYSIIQEHGGTINYQSELGKGTEVLITLPN
jgi:PAS domain S-box-containing protein